MKMKAENIETLNKIIIVLNEMMTVESNFPNPSNQLIKLLGVMKSQIRQVIQDDEDLTEKNEELQQQIDQLYSEIQELNQDSIYDPDLEVKAEKEN